MDMTFDGIRTHFYTIQSMGRQPVDLKIGTFCHEAGHLICRFPDLYDYGKRDGDSDPSSGLGAYCLMASGSHLDSGRTPAPISAYLRSLAGWTGQVHLLNDGGEFRAAHGNYDTLYKYQLADRPNEYFLIENRSRMGLDAHCTSNGLAVYHCDILGSNEWQGGTADNHYQCALIQADGARHLENNRNYGDEGDLFQDHAGLVLAHDTVPSSRAWGGEDSGLCLFDVGAPGEVIAFTVGRHGEPDSHATTLVRKSRPSALIPDDDPKGISDTIIIPAHGTIAQMSLAVDISHTYIGDLKLELISPKGDRITLREKKGGSADDLKETYDTDGVLADLVGDEILGIWTLSVADLAGQDIGKLRSWSIEAAYRPRALDFAEEKTVNRSIADNDPAGIADTITVTQGGQVESLAVSINITHTYHGDLTVRLAAPSGRSATLIEFNTLGSTSGTLSRDFSDRNLAALKALLGEPATGDWTLTVSDNRARDEGTLNRWVLQLS
jgi:subtilisin-like proprotein convertase family protein